MTNFKNFMDRTIELISITLLLALLLCVTLGIVTRSLGDPLIWTDEASRFIMIWMAVFGWMLASRRSAHIRIRFVLNHLSAQNLRATEITLQIAMLIFGVAISLFGSFLVISNNELDAITIPISMSWMYMPIVLGGMATALQSLADIRAVILKPDALVNTVREAL